MDGVTILNEIVKNIEPLPILHWQMFLGAVIIGTIVLIIGIIMTILEKDADIAAFLSVISVMFILLWVVVGITYEMTQAEPYTIIQYEVTISDDISLTEFNKKYEIIEQRGKIYVVQEKETQED